MTMKTEKTEKTIDYVAWVRHANARWIVHHNLSLNADAYLNHLAQVDAGRLLASCHNAYLMIWQRDQREDPKPWFYSGLFSLATPDESRKFLAGHWLTKQVTASSNDALPLLSESREEMTQEKIRHLQEALSKLPDFPQKLRSNGRQASLKRSC